MIHFRLNKTIKSYPSLPYQTIKEDILGHDYLLELNFIGEKRALTLNRCYRKKTYIPNVLAFPLNKDCGEIYITPATAKQESAKFNLSQKGYVGYLFIHGLLHLKGFEHGTKMDNLEKKYIDKYHLK